ncbi:hypothetical protein GW17_00031578, partial [Ensete ventricosum]
PARAVARDEAIGGDRLRSSRKGQLPAVRLQGAAPRLRLPLAGVGDAARARQPGPPARCCPRVAAPVAGAVTHSTSMQCCRPRGGDDGDAEGQESLGHSF